MNNLSSLQDIIQSFQERNLYQQNQHEQLLRQIWKDLSLQFCGAQTTSFSHYKPDTMVLYISVSHSMALCDLNLQKQQIIKTINNKLMDQNMLPIESVRFLKSSSL